MAPIVIFGCGGHGRSVGDVILFNDPAARLIYVDSAARTGETILGFDALRDVPDDTSYSCIVGIGDNAARKTMFDLISRKTGLTVISVISRTAHLGRNSRIEAGSFIGNFCHVGPEVSVGCNSILNNACVVDHEVSIGRHCHIGPNATISGRSKIGDLVFIGVGATVIDKVSVCSNVIIGAGATVTKDITEPGTYVGTPVRRLAW